ncbi:MAG: hypothetical protein DHS20C10_09630 [marine bacterium B5-7]|nr:MAG: hypothetical protein DHS20C10_09630 [marine bacterium B5-7]
MSAQSSTSRKTCIRCGLVKPLAAFHAYEVDEDGTETSAGSNAGGTILIYSAICQACALGNPENASVDYNHQIRRDLFAQEQTAVERKQTDRETAKNREQHDFKRDHELGDKAKTEKTNTSGLDGKTSSALQKSKSRSGAFGRMAGAASQLFSGKKSTASSKARSGNTASKSKQTGTKASKSSQSMFGQKTSSEKSGSKSTPQTKQQTQQTTKSAAENTRRESSEATRMTNEGVFRDMKIKVVKSTNGGAKSSPRNFISPSSGGSK